MIRRDAEAAAALEQTASSVRACVRCRLHRTRTLAVPGEGPVHPQILFVGEAPGRDEDASGRPFVGRAGRILDRSLAAAGLAREAVFITNVVKCRPPGNRRPKADEVRACRPYLLAQLEALRPRVVVTLGSTALRSVLGPGVELREVRGRTLEYRGIPTVPTYHPAAVLYNRKLEAVLVRDLRKVARLGKPELTAGTRGAGPAAKRSRRPPR